MSGWLHNSVAPRDYQDFLARLVFSPAPPEWLAIRRPRLGTGSTRVGVLLLLLHACMRAPLCRRRREALPHERTPGKGRHRGPAVVAQGGVCVCPEAAQWGAGVA